MRRIAEVIGHNQAGILLNYFRPITYHAVQIVKHDNSPTDSNRIDNVLCKFITIFTKEII